MRASLILPMLGLCLAAAPARAAPAQVELGDRTIRVADIALPGAVSSTAHGERVIATIPEGIAKVSLSEERRRELLRRQFPSATPELRHEGDVVFHAPPAAEMTQPSNCLVLREPVSAGEYIGSESVEPVACRSASSAARVRYDRTARALRAETNLAAGAYLGALDVPARAPLAAGTELKLVSRSGPVELTRDVRLLQSGRTGSAAFVRTADGEVFAVPVMDAESRK